MSTPLYTTDVQKITYRTAKTTLADTDVLVVADSSGTLAPITKVNAKTTLGINGNADAIALRELLSNKKTTLADNSDTFYPTQKAVKTVTDYHENRIDNIIASSGTSDTEVVDARLSGITGVLYDLLKNRLDAMEKYVVFTDELENPLVKVGFRLVGEQPQLVMEEI